MEGKDIKDIYLFKNEIYKKIRELEIKFSSELANKNSQINLNLKTFNEKVSSILESNRKMIESVTNQKMTFEKVNELDASKKKMDETLISQNIKLNSIVSEINKINYRYESLMKDNILIPGYVGPSCKFKNLGEFIINSIKDISKLKEIKEITMQQDKDFRNKMDILIRNMNNMVENNAKKLREIEEKKDNKYESLIDIKLNKYKEKSVEDNQNLFKVQKKLENKVNEINIEIIKLTDSRQEIDSLINNKFEEINKKEEEINEKLLSTINEIEEVKKIKKELNEKINNIFSRFDNNQIKNKFVRHQNKLKTGIVNNKSINLFDNNKIDNNIKSFGTKNKKNFPILNNSNNNTLSSNNFYNRSSKEKKITFSIRHESRKEINKLNLLSDKKPVTIKENNFTKGAKNLRVNDIVKEFNKEPEIQKETSIINSEKKEINKTDLKKDEKININNYKTELKIVENTNINNEINNGKSIREKIFQKTLNSFKIRNKDSDRQKKKIISNIGIQSLLKDVESNKEKFQLDNNETIKNIPEKILSMSDDENLRRTKTYHYSKIKKILKVKNNEKNTPFSSKKNIQTATRNNLKIVDCNLVNLNLIDVPNINDDNSNSSSEIDILYKSSLKKRKINSVDSKRPFQTINKIENDNVLYFSSKGTYKLKK